MECFCKHGKFAYLQFNRKVSRLALLYNSRNSYCALPWCLQGRLQIATCHDDLAYTRNIPDCYESKFTNVADVLYPSCHSNMLPNQSTVNLACIMSPFDVFQGHFMLDPLLIILELY